MKAQDMIDPWENDSLEDQELQITHRWEGDISELDNEDWEHYLGGPEDEYFEPDYYGYEE